MFAFELWSHSSPRGRMLCGLRSVRDGPDEGVPLHVLGFACRLISANERRKLPYKQCAIKLGGNCVNSVRSDQQPDAMMKKFYLVKCSDSSPMQIQRLLASLHWEGGVWTGEPISLKPLRIAEITEADEMKVIPPTKAGVKEKQRFSRIRALEYGWGQEKRSRWILAL